MIIWKYHPLSFLKNIYTDYRLANWNFYIPFSISYRLLNCFLSNSASTEKNHHYIQHTVIRKNVVFSDCFQDFLFLCIPHFEYNGLGVVLFVFIPLWFHWASEIYSLKFSQIWKIDYRYFFQLFSAHLYFPLTSSNLLYFPVTSTRLHVC